MRRGLRQPSERFNQALAAYFTSFLDRLSAHKLSQRRAACDGRDAAFGFESNLVDAVRLHFQAKTNDIPAGRVRNFSRSIRLADITRVPGILKVVE